MSHPAKFLDLHTFKVTECNQEAQNHNLKKCPYYHDYKKDRRRPLGTYSSEMCSYLTSHSPPKSSSSSKKCPHGDVCDRAHNRVEEFYHPDKYKAKFCSSFLVKGKQCDYQEFCSFAHTEEELSVDLIEKFEFDLDFYLFHFKTVWCPYREDDHDRKICVYAHNWQDYRRKPSTYKYSQQMCQSWKTDNFISAYEDGCKLQYHCNYSHGWKEQEYHPEFFKTRQCKHGETCSKPHCPYWHTSQDKKLPLTQWFHLFPKTRIVGFQTNFYMPVYGQQLNNMANKQTVFSRMSTEIVCNKKFLNVQQQDGSSSSLSPQRHRQKILTPQQQHMRQLAGINHQNQQQHHHQVQMMNFQQQQQQQHQQQQQNQQEQYQQQQQDVAFFQHLPQHQLHLPLSMNQVQQQPQQQSNQSQFIINQQMQQQQQQLQGQFMAPPNNQMSMEQQFQMMNLQQQQQQKQKFQQQQNNAIFQLNGMDYQYNPNQQVQMHNQQQNYYQQQQQANPQVVASQQNLSTCSENFIPTGLSPMRAKQHKQDDTANSGSENSSNRGSFKIRGRGSLLMLNRSLVSSSESNQVYRTKRRSYVPELRVSTESKKIDFDTLSEERRLSQQNANIHAMQLMKDPMIEQALSFVSEDSDQVSESSSQITPSQYEQHGKQLTKQDSNEVSSLVANQDNEEQLDKVSQNEEVLMNAAQNAIATREKSFKYDEYQDQANAKELLLQKSNTKALSCSSPITVQGLSDTDTQGSNRKRRSILEAVEEMNAASEETTPMNRNKSKNDQQTLTSTMQYQQEFQLHLKSSHVNDEPQHQKFPDEN